MELRQLKLFVAAAERGGFSQAAKALYTSHSTISRAVSALEKELGVQLVERTNKVERLTPAGELLLKEGKALLETERELEDRVKAIGMSEETNCPPLPRFAKKP